MVAIAEEAKSDPAKVRGAPHSTFVARLDEARAARKPILRWDPESGEEFCRTLLESPHENDRGDRRHGSGGCG